MKQPRFIIALILVILVGILLLQNTQVVTLKIYFWEISMSQIILLPLVLLLGLLVGYGIARFKGKTKKEEQGPERQG
ncbi:MAG: lipopolysaccharide assembly protein LapA domain-containing protein [Desulfatiglandales bacterium]